MTDVASDRRAARPASSPRVSPTSLGLVLAAALVGAGGLGGEALLLESAGLAFGAGRGAPVGLALYVAGWALGAWGGGRVPFARPRVSLLLRVLWVVALPVGCFAGLVSSQPESAHALMPHLRLLANVVLLIAVGAAQGELLPRFVHVRELRVGARGGVQALWVANLVGAVVGAFLFAGTVAAAHGRFRAIVVAGAASGLGVVVAALLAPPRVEPGARSEPVPRPEPGAPPLRLGLLIGAATAWVLAIEFVTLRLVVLWLGGMQNALAAHLGASLIALFVGALVLPPLLPRRRHARAGLAVLIGLAACGGVWPLFAAPALRAALGSGAPSDARALGVALTLVGPALLAFGAMVPVAFRAATAGDEGRAGEAARLGDLLLHEAWGALLGGPLVTLLLVPRIGLAGALGVGALLGAVGCGLALGRAALAPAALCVGAAAVAFLAEPPARSSPRLANPAFEFQAFAEDAGFAVSVVDDGLLGERTLLTDGFRAAGAGRDYRYMRMLGHLPVLLHPDPERVCVLALGTGTTVGAVSLHPEVESIEVLELSSAVVEQAPMFEAVNLGALRDPRVTVTAGDGRRTLARRVGAYDVVTLEPLLADSPFAVYLYTRGFYEAARSALRPGGIVCQWVPPHALAPETFQVVVDAFVAEFPASSLWLFDTQLALIGADEPPGFPTADRFPGAGELRDALDELGVASPGALVAHRVGPGDGWPRAARPLTDIDPWIVYPARRQGARLIADLALNLRALGAIEEAPPPEPGLRPAEFARAQRRWSGLRALARARAARALDEAELRGFTADVVVRPSLERELTVAAEALAPDDPALLHFTGELAFVEALRRGVSLLSAGDSRTALEPLTTAAELRPERGDVHLYLAAALQAAGVDAAAQRAFEAARERCPRILETPPGERVLALGFEPPRWTKL